jgi:hypothetical protein
MVLDNVSEKEAFRATNLMNNRPIYTVVGKGGLIREVLIPSKLATKLEKYKLNEPVNKISGFND